MVDGILNGDTAVGTITGTGATITYTAPALAGSHTVSATSIADTTKSASAAVMVTSASTFPSSNHVFVVMEENQGFSQVFPSKSAINCSSAGMPYLCSLASVNGLALNFYSNHHGSLLDYLYNTSGSLWMGSPYNCTGIDCASIGVINKDNLVRALAKAGKTWRGYFEDMPSKGYIGGDTGNYVAHHNPFIWYSDVANSVSQQDNMYPFTQFAQDVKANSFQNFNYIVPDLLHDAEGTGAQTSRALLLAADNWLKANIDPLLSTPPFQPGGDGILIVVFDEANVAGDSGDSTSNDSCSPTQPSGCGGHIAFVMIGPNVKPGSTTSTTYHFQDMLHTIIHLLGMTDYMNNASGGKDIALLPGVP
jgi:acid phosphatase